MLLFIVGGVLAALGLLSAAVLVLAPLGLVPASPGWSVWVLFPAFTLVGFALLAIGARSATGLGPTRWVAVPMLLLALGAAAGLVAHGTGLVQAATTLPLWYVMTLGGVMGGIGSAVGGRPASA